MNLKIINATYGSNNVTKQLNDFIKNNFLIIKANNTIFGDSDIGVLKTLKIEYSYNNIIYNVSILENETIKIPQSKSDRLGIFYTNNDIDNKILNKSLESIKIASSKNNVEILTSVWLPIKNNPFHEIMSMYKVSSHFNIAFQILTLLLNAKKINKDFKYVSFLEHDVIYGENYFMYDDFECEVISNENFIGFKDGFQDKIQQDQPLHELTMNFNYAIGHFSEILIEYIIGENVLEPQVHYIKWYSKEPSVHINHGKNFTSHYNIYSKKINENNKYWGNYKTFLN